MAYAGPHQTKAGATHRAVRLRPSSAASWRVRPAATRAKAMGTILRASVLLPTTANTPAMRSGLEGAAVRLVREERLQLAVGEVPGLDSDHRFVEVGRTELRAEEPPAQGDAGGSRSATTSPRVATSQGRGGDSDEVAHLAARFGEGAVSRHSGSER
jgi:hypothetical protein